MDDDVGVSPDGGGEVGIDGGVEGVVYPGGGRTLPREEVVGCLEQVYHLVLDDVLH